MNEYLYRIRPIRSEMLSEGPTPEESALVSAHFEYLQRLTEAGVVILAGRTQNDDPTSFGIVIFKAISEDEAREILEADPAVAGGVFAGELFPFKIALAGEFA